MNDHIFAVDATTARELQALLRFDRGALEAIGAKVQAAREPGGSRSEAGGVISVIPVYGFIEQRTSLFGMFFGSTSTEGLAKAFRQSMLDPNVKAIVLDISSGGGSVFGVSELVNEIISARGAKPIVAQVNSMAASAAYWIAASADEIVSVPSGISGSIGVYAIHQDYSKAEEMMGIKTEIIAAGEHKADQVDGAPLSDAGRESMQEMVDHFYGLFVGDIASGRGISKEAVKADFGKGLTMTAPAAKSAGLVDRIATLDDTLRRLSTPQGRSAVKMRAEVLAESGEAEIRLRLARVQPRIEV